MSGKFSKRQTVLVYVLTRVEIKGVSGKGTPEHNKNIGSNIEVGGADRYIGVKFLFF